MVGNRNIIDNIDLPGLTKNAYRVAEKHYIETALIQTGWNRIQSAHLLGISGKTLGRKIAKYHIAKPQSIANRSH